MAKRKPLTPHQKIVRAADRGTGVRLTADDVLRLSLDDAVSMRATHDDETDLEVPDER